jgi:CheY-like chemotaxis protein
MQNSRSVFLNLPAVAPNGTKVSTSNPKASVGSAGQSAPDSPAQPGLAKILVVDDDPAVRTVIQAQLRRAGHKVEVAEDGCTAVQLCRQFRPDVVLLDIFMPEKDGLETIPELRRADPNVKIMIISGAGGGGYDPCLDTARLLGARQVLRKPFTVTELSEAVNILLQHDGSASA